MMKLRVELFVADLKESVKFYSEILRFQCPDNLSSHYVSLQSGSAVLGLGLMDGLDDRHPLKAENPQERWGIGVELVLESDDIDGFYKHVLSKGVDPSAPLAKRPWGSTDFRITDPDGYYWRITST
ncbi:VOC family protein [Alteribacter natronophilus]|uniref:VOC family protein n=1 Tax=Alteribacter natronophilus TaxID=2583810 RepID=UPI00110D6995|nr:VOC family protein [Alteribacter natronophilus]TMW72799.1 VOC family protein [Alteribacter natronophilus]